MKKTLFQQSWLTLCILITTFILLCTSFSFSIICNSEQFENSRYSIKNNEKYELSAFCETFGKEREAADRASGNIINWNGDLLPTYGVGAKEQYDIFSFLADMVERILDNLRFDFSAMLASPFKNLFVYILCLSCTVSGIVMLVKGFYKSTSSLLQVAKNFKKENATLQFNAAGQLALFTPIFIWIGKIGRASCRERVCQLV